MPSSPKFAEQRHSPGRRRVDKAVFCVLLAAALAAVGKAALLGAQAINSHFAHADDFAAFQAKYRQDQIVDSITLREALRSLRSGMDSGFLSVKGCIRHRDCP